MDGWKKAAVGVVILAIILQCTMLYADAAYAGGRGRADSRETVFVDLSKAEGNVSDFVTERPGVLYYAGQEDHESSTPPEDPPQNGTADGTTGSDTDNQESTGNQSNTGSGSSGQDSTSGGSTEGEPSDGIADGDQTPSKGYESLELTYAEKQLLARVAYVFRDAESLKALQEKEIARRLEEKGVLEQYPVMENPQALIEILLNRLLSQEYPDQLKSLVYGTEGICEAELLKNAVVTSAEYAIVEKAMNGPHIVDANVTDF